VQAGSTGNRSDEVVRVGLRRDLQLQVFLSESPQKAATLSPVVQLETQAKDSVYPQVYADLPLPEATQPPGRPGRAWIASTSRPVRTAGETDWLLTGLSGLQ
jgi:hypothetical protein